jgi:hypothetical protein
MFCKEGRKGREGKEWKEWKGRKGRSAVCCGERKRKMGRGAC